MPMRGRISLSLAMLMISTTALAGTPQSNGSEPLIQPPSGGATGKSRSARRTAHRRPAILRASGSRQIGRAAWYALEGGRTASGERMDDARATAAHRSLPLLSYARVTNLRNGRSVVVQINDRGPMSHRFVIDLSPRAAEEIDMLKRGVAEVEVQPIAAPPAVQQVAAVE